MRHFALFLTFLLLLLLPHLQRRLSAHLHKLHFGIRQPFFINFTFDAHFLPCPKNGDFPWLTENKNRNKNKTNTKWKTKPKTPLSA